MAIPIFPDVGAQPRSPGLGSGLQIISRKPIVSRCRVCGAGFHEEEHRQFVNHTINCAKKHEEQIREELDLGYQMPGLFGPDAGDKEYRDWHRERKGWRC